MLIYEYKVGDSVKGEEFNSNDIKYQSLIGKGLKFQMQKVYYINMIFLIINQEIR